MKLSIDRAQLLPALKVLKKALNPAKGLGLQDCTHLETNAPDALNVRAHDSQHALCVSLPCVVERSGIAAVSSASLLHAVDQSAEQIHLEYDAESFQVNVKSAGRRFRMATANAEDYRPFPAAITTGLWTIGVQLLRLLISRTRHALDEKADVQKPSLHGVWVFPDQGRVAAVAASTKLVAYATVEGVARDTLLIPRAVAKILGEHMPDEGEVSFTQSDREIHAAFGSWKLAALKIDGTRTEDLEVFRRFVHETPELKATIVLDRQSLLEGLSAVRGLSGEEDRVTIKADGKSKLLVAANATGQGDARADLDGSINGAGQTLLAGGLITESVRAYSDKTVKLALGSRYEPVLVEESGGRVVISPLRGDLSKEEPLALEAPAPQPAKRARSKKETVNASA